MYVYAYVFIMLTAENYMLLLESSLCVYLWHKTKILIGAGSFIDFGLNMKMQYYNWKTLK